MARAQFQQPQSDVGEIMEQESLLDWKAPQAFRNTDPPTSREAAERANMHASHGRMVVLEQLALRAMTDFELAAATGWLATSIGKRRHECMMAGLVERALDGRGEDVRRPSPSGSPALVWSITADGRAFYAERCK